MAKTLEKHQQIERSIITTYRKEIWSPFVLAVKKYRLIEKGDKIAVCISGGKDSFLLAKCLQELQRLDALTIFGTIAGIHHDKLQLEGHFTAVPLQFLQAFGEVQSS